MNADPRNRSGGTTRGKRNSRDLAINIKTYRRRPDDKKQGTSSRIIPKSNISKTSVGPDTVEREKKLIMISGVTFFMLLVIFTWVYQTKKSISNSAASGADMDFGAQFRQTTENLEKELESLQKHINKAGEPASGTIPASSTPRSATSAVTTQHPKKTK